MTGEVIYRVNFWGLEHNGAWETVGHVFAYFILPLCALIMLARFFLHIRVWWKVGRPDRRWDCLGTRVGRLIQYGVVQTKILRQKYPGIMHVLIAWSFFVFFLGTAIATIDADVPILFGFSDEKPSLILNGGWYLFYKFALDTFTILFLVGVLIAAFRRFVQKPERLTKTGSFVFMWGLVSLFGITGLIIESTRLAAVAQDTSLQPGWHEGLAWSTPAGWAIAKIWLGAGMAIPGLITFHNVAWVVHACFVGIFFLVLPTTKLVHIFTSPLNTFFSKLDRPVGQLAPAVVQEGGAAGAGKLSDLTWKQLMDGDACTECGRCQDACPAHYAKTPLSPKELMISIREGLHGKNGFAKTGADAPEFVGQGVADPVLWSCTTCGSCVAECPVLIEHVDSIVDMRRYLLFKQRADAELMTVLGSFRRYGNSFGQSDRKRAVWTKDIVPKVKDIRKEPADTLWFVGDYASYSQTLVEPTQMTARVFRRAGIDFGILYDGERNAGNDVRRIGEEGLFEMLAMKNKQVLEKCEFKEIVTTDPHTLNTLKNEYFANGNGKPVPPIRHYSEVLDDALRSGKLKVSRKLGYTVTYHDPCYLGRYNGIYEPARRVLEAIGCRIVEMPRNRSKGFCCGAGGGRIWMNEEVVKQRPSEDRIREALALGSAECFVVACPKDLTMYRDAVKTVGAENKLRVKDLIELVDEATAEAETAAPAVETAAAGSTLDKEADA
jgi:Fe-S oxidoreductase